MRPDPPAARAVTAHVASSTRPTHSTSQHVKKVLVVDVGGTNVKLFQRGRGRVKIPSGPDLTPREMMAGVLAATDGWSYDVVTIGYPGPVVRGKIAREPINLGSGWVRFDFARAFGCPVRMINDAAMQALGSYEGGRMLFLGLGTGLGTTLVTRRRRRAPRDGAPAVSRRAGRTRSTSARPG